MLDEIAVEHAKGRILLVGTTDSRRPPGGDLEPDEDRREPRSARARSVPQDHDRLGGDPGRPSPPTMIEVEVDGQRYEEMHVDGGCTAQVLRLYPPAVKPGEDSRESRGSCGTATCNVIRKRARLDPEWSDVERRTLTIAQRAVGSLIQTQGMGDPLPASSRPRARDGRRLQTWRASPISSTRRTARSSTTDYMKALYDVAFNAAAHGYAWEKSPPNFAQGDGGAGAGVATGPRRGSRPEPHELERPAPRGSRRTD